MPVVEYWETPLNAISTGTVECNGYTIEKIAYESRPGFHVTGNFNLSKNRDGRIPGVYMMSGHQIILLLTYLRHIDMARFYLAGVEMIALLKIHVIRINDSATMLYEESEMQTQSRKFDFGTCTYHPSRTLSGFSR